LQDLLHSLKTDCGGKRIYQSQKNLLTTRSMEMLNLMANNEDILDQFGNAGDQLIELISNTYLSGIAKMIKTIRTTDPMLSKF
jgi:hypothetical protein